MRMAIAHAHFEAVHPFRDGNGRVGRLLLPLMMAAEGHIPLYLSPYIEANKTRYYASLKRTAASRMVRSHRLHGGGNHRNGERTDCYAGGAFEARGAVARKTKIPRRVWALKALQLLPHYPVLTIKRLAAILNVSVPAATQAIEQLMETGILTERAGHKRNRVFSALEVLLIINRPFGETPILPESEGPSNEGALPQNGISCSQRSVPEITGVAHRRRK